MIVLILFLLIFASGACGCDFSGKSVNQSKAPENTESSSETEEATVRPCLTNAHHNYVEISRTDALALKGGEIRYQCTYCKNEITEKLHATNSLKVLALGNSFTDDSTWHLWNICNDAGIEDLIVANLYVGNCNLNQHWDHISNNKSPYIYRKTVTGTRVDTENYSVIDALRDEDWDVIVLHQTSGSAGQAYTYENLDKIIDFINTNKTNPNARIVWHMPWAYQSDSNHSEFIKYNNDQKIMYETIVKRVNQIILPKGTISAVIPSGTAIQNLRTSFIGDNVTRDGYHLDYGFGRYTAGLTWYAILTGGDVDAPEWIPEKYPEVAAYLPAIREAVKGALKNNFEVTESTENILANTLDLSNYELLEWNYVTNAHWNCSASTSIVTPSASDTTLYNTNICVDRMYSIDELPVGTVFGCDNGWRFRLEQFPSENETYTGSRHGGCTKPYFVLTEEFLSGCTYLSWSVSSNPRRDISAQFDEAYTHIKIYVPKG